ncbi:MAG: hypothetical protein J7513_03275 [Solirubrobacteraceae bacterium]|nr:hypothetical protein [Solirubrobacteraceae bacterium]
MAVTERIRMRGPVGALGVLLVLAGLWSLAIPLIVGVVPQSPNPYVMDGDPCCGIPDTWAEVREGVFWGWIWLFPGAVAITTGALLLAAAVRGRRPRWRRLPVGVAALMSAAAAAIAITYLTLDEAPEVVHCREIRERAPGYRSASLAERKDLAFEIADCRLLSHRTMPEVIALLGPPARITYPPGPVTENWHYGTGLLSIRFTQYPGTADEVVEWVSGD